MGKNHYWIADPNGGAKALVEGAEERNRWVQVHGWDEAEEPGPDDQVWAYNPNTDGRARLPYGVMGEKSYWRSVGFEPAGPAEPVDLTRDPALRDQAKPAVEPAETPTTKPATGADKSSKE